MGAGGGIWERARAELLRPGLSAGGAGISIVFSGGRGVDKGAGAITGWTGFLAAGAVAADLAGGLAFAAEGAVTALRAFTAFAAGLACGGGGVLMVFLVMGLAATPFFSVLVFAPGLACGLTAFVLATGLLFALAALTDTGLAITLAAGFLLAPGLATVFPLTGNLAALAGSFAETLAEVLAAVFTTAFALTATFDAAFADVFNFFSCAFTVCLLWKPPLDTHLNEPSPNLTKRLPGYFARRAIVAAQPGAGTARHQTVGESIQT